LIFDIGYSSGDDFPNSGVSVEESLEIIPDTNKTFATGVLIRVGEWHPSQTGCIGENLEKKNSWNLFCLEKKSCRGAER